MINEIDSMQIHGWGEESQVTDERVIRHSYQELHQSLIAIKNNIVDCIHDLENAAYVKPSLVETMKSSMNDIEHAKKVVCMMKGFNFKGVDLP